MCLSGLRGLHPQLDEVVQAGPLQDPTAATITTMTITNGDGMQRVMEYRTQSVSSTDFHDMQGFANGKSMTKEWDKVAQV
ncbi:hypothetical protein Tco_0936214 [Tanacetum coccineum]